MSDDRLAEIKARLALVSNSREGDDGWGLFGPWVTKNFQWLIDENKVLRLELEAARKDIALLEDDVKRAKLRNRRPR